MPKTNTTTGRFAPNAIHWTPETWDAGYVDNKGRFRVYRPDYPRAYKGGWALRTHVVWWLAHGKCHPRGTDLHHKDEDKLNDRLDNIEQKTHAAHTKHHSEKPALKFVCENCGDPFKVDRWRTKGRVIRFCSQACYHAAPRAADHKKKIAAGLARAYRSGRR